mgnify:FL=1
MQDLRDIQNQQEWAGLKTILKMERERTVISTNQTTYETLYYISSRSMTAEQALFAIGSHWGIQNPLHYVLDVQFQEDNSRVRNSHADANLATIRKIALNMIKLNQDKESINVKRHKAAWDDSFRENIIKI